MKRLSVIFYLLLLLILLTGLFSCDNEGEVYSVNFMVGDEIYQSLTVNKGEIVSMPTPPSVDNLEFGGWFYDKECTISFDGRAPITENTNVYALLSPHTHSYEKANTYAPTCTSEGYTLYLCICGDNYKGDITEKTGHSYKERVFDSSCTTYGFRQFTCECGHYYREEIEPKGHDYVSQEIEPTYNNGGYTLHTCQRCGHSYMDNFSPTIPHDHDFEIEKTDATCTENGVIVSTCKLCGLELTEEIEAKGHDYEEFVSIPSETQQGYTEYTCRVCNHSYRDNFTDPLPEGHIHSWANTEKAPTCLEGGYTTHTCTGCGFSYKDTYTDPKGHNYEAIVFPPSETEQGFTQYTCKDCGEAYIGDFISPHKHKYEAEKIHPTCQNGGYTIFTCTICNYSYEDDWTQQLDHTYKIDVTEPTCTAEGYTTYTCEECGDTYVDNRVSALEHQYEVTEYVSSTCQSIGYYVFACNMCGDEYIQNEQGYGSHVYEKTVKEPSCTDSGYTNYKCKLCQNEYQDDYLPPLGHDFNLSWVYATCTEMGYTIHQCKRCDYYYWDGYTEPKGHHMSEWGYNENEHYKVCLFCHNYTEKHERHYGLNCECGYIHPVGTLWFFDEGDSYLYYQYQKPESGLLDIVIPATYNGKPVRFSFDSIDDGVRSLTVEKGVILEATGNSLPGFDNLEELYFYCDAYEDNGYSWLLGSCKNLKRLVLPRNMKIARGLHECNIEELYVPSTLRSFSGEGTKIKSIYFEGSLSEFVEFDESVEALLSSAEELYINGKLVKDLVITDEITVLNNNSFKGCGSIESITFENQNPIEMGESVFEGCVNLKKVTLSKGVQNLGGFAFKGCTSLQSVDFAQGLTKIRYGAFKDCSSLTYADLPQGLEEIDSQIFYGCDSLKWVYLPDIKTVTRIISSWQTSNNYSILDEKSTAVLLMQDDIESSAEANLIYTNGYLPYGGFECTSTISKALSYYYNASNEDYFEVGEFAYVKSGNNAHVVRYFGNSENVIVPSSVAYKGQNLTVTDVNDYLLKGVNAKALHIPSTVYIVGNVMGTDTLKSITVDKDSEYLTSIDGVLYSSTMKTLIYYPPQKQGSVFDVPSTVTTIRPYAFPCPEYLLQVNVPVSSSISDESFITLRNIVIVTNDHTSVTNQYGIIAISGDTSMAYQNGFGYILNDGYAQIAFYHGDAKELSIPAQITVNGTKYKVSGIFSGAFYKNNTLEKVVLEDGIQIVGSYSDSWELPKGYRFNSDTIQDLRGWDFANHHAFYGCENLKEIILPNSVTHIFGLANSCQGLENVVFGENLKYIHTGIKGSPAIKKITFPKSIIKMGIYTLTDCDNMEEITIGTLGMTKHNENATMTLETYAIWLKNPLKKVILGDEVKTHNSVGITSAFGTRVEVMYVGAGTSDLIHDGYEELHFYGDIYEYISKPISIWAKHLYLKGELFGGTASFDKEIIEGIQNRFIYNEDITHIILTEDETEIYGGQFEYCPNLKELTIKGEGIILNSFAFMGVNTLTIEGSIAQIKGRCFENVNKVVVDSVANWMSIDYVGDEDISIMADGADFYLIGSDTPYYEIVIPESITKIKSLTFAGLDFSKYSIKMHDKITEIENRAFVNLSSYYDTDALSGLDTNGWYWAHESDPEALYAYEGEDLHRDMLKERDRYWFKLN